MRTRIVVGILAIQAAAVAVFAMVDGQLGDRAIAGQMEAILDLTAKNATADVNAYVEAMERAASVVISDVTDAGDDREGVEQGLYDALAYVSHLSGAYVGDAAGGFLYVRATDEGYVTKEIVPAAPGGDREVHLTTRTDDLDVVSSEIDPEDDYDPSIRPWFVGAVEADGVPIWTEPYIFFTSQQPGMTRAALIDGDGPQSVAGVDFELSALVELIDQLSTNINGEVTIQTADGMLLTPEGSFESDLVPDNALARTRAAEERRLEGLTGDRVMYEFEGAAHIRHVAQVGPADNPWTLALDLSEQDVVYPMLNVFERQRALAVAIGLLAVLAMALMVQAPLQRLEAESTTDALTKLANRREILRRGERLADEADGYSIAMLDIDHFKGVNDQFGHPVGDEVLRGTAERLTHPDIRVGRLGGEEFLLLIKPEPAGKVQEILARVRADLVGHPVETSAGPISITASFGVRTHARNTTFSTVLAGADSALLEAKRSGRDRIVRFEDLGTLRLANGAAPFDRLTSDGRTSNRQPRKAMELRQ